MDCLWSPQGAFKIAGGAVDPSLMAKQPRNSTGLRPILRLKTLVLVSSGILAVIPVAMMGLTQSVHLKSSHTRIYEQRAEHRARFVAEQTSEMVGAKRKALEALAFSISSLNLSRSPKLPALLQVYKEKFSLWSLYLVDPDGYEIVSGKGGHRHYFGDRDYFKRLLQTHKTVISDAIIGRISGMPTVQIVVPIFDSKGQIKLILSSSLSLSELRNELSKPVSKDVMFEYLILDSQQRVLVSFGANSRATLSKLGINHPLQTQPLAANTFFAGTDETGTEIHGFARETTLDGLGWKVALVWPKSAILNEARKAARETLLFSLAALVLSLALSYLVAQILSGPQTEFVQALLTMGENDLDRPILLKRGLLTVEMVDLKNAFERMRGRLHEHTLYLEETIEARTRELEVQRAKTEYAGKMATLGEMASGIAHEINNPLAIICANAERMLGMLHNKKVDEAKLEQGIERISNTAFRIAKIVKGLRFFAQDGSRVPFKSECLQTIVQDTLEFCQEKFRSHAVDLKLGTFPSELKIDCQAVQISQVLLNLLQNAFDAVEKLETRWIRVETLESDTEVRITVTDSGPGVSAELRDKIMLPFFTTKEVGKGTGLGLSISQGIVASHGGSLYIDANAQNSCFVICLPKVQRSTGGSEMGLVA